MSALSCGSVCHQLRPEEAGQCLAACDEISECYRVLEKAGLNVVGEVLRGQGAFYELDHYPRDDVHDHDFHSQYYYHAHRDDHEEHGHFHLFVRAGAVPADWQPCLGPEGDERVVHLAAISMDAWGYPIELFTVNRWVTDESWLPAAQTIALLDRFTVDHAYPSWPVNRWLTAMVRCFRPQLAQLLAERDQALVAHQRSRTWEEVLEDRSLEVTSRLVVDVPSWRQYLLRQYSGNVAAARCQSEPSSPESSAR